MAIAGMAKITYISQKFHSKLFIFIGVITNKDELLDLLCQKATNYYHLNDEFRTSVMFHESIANTFFGNHIAMPHPDTYITNENFICVGIPSKPLVWDDETDIRLVLLVSIKKDDPTSLKIWQYLSFLIADDNLIKSIIEVKDYNSFYKILKEFYIRIIDEL